MALCALALSLTACSEPKPIEELPRPVRVMKVDYVSALTTARYSGEVKVRHEPALSFQVSGKLAKRLVDVGTVVRPGDLLATLDPPDYRLNQASATAQRDAAQAELAKAHKDLAHSANLLAKDLTSPAHHERLLDAVHVAEARLAQAQAGLALSARQSAYVELRAEHPGVITAVETEPGQVLTAGQTVLRLARTAEKEVEIHVPENRLEDLRSASAISVSLWAKPGVFHEGRVREISPSADALIRTFAVKVSIPGAPDELRMGMTATVHVQRREPQPVAWLPLTAVGQEGGRTLAWVFDAATQSAHPQAIALAGYEGDKAKITGGIKADALVVTAGIHKLLPGQKLRVLEEGR